MKIRYTKDALKFLSKLDKKSVFRIRNAIEKLAENQFDGDIKPLEGYHDGRKRLRVGGWRVIFRFENEFEIEILLVLDIGNRGDIYK